VRKLALAAYFGLIYLSCLALVVEQARPLVGGTVAHSLAGITPWYAAVVIFVVLAYAGERTHVYVSGATNMSLATPVDIALILLCPPPYPLLIALLAMLISQAAHERPSLYKLLDCCDLTGTG